MTTQILGYSGHQSHDRCEYLTLAFSPLSAPLRSRWRNNGLSADFLGDYVTTFLPSNGGAPALGSRQAEIKHAVTYIANELLENAMKYHQHNVDIPIRIHLELTGDNITVSASNGVGGGQAQCYKTFVERILEEDAGELLVKQLEENSGNDPSSPTSCLGLLTMINDYGAQLGWMFEVHPDFAEVMTVTTTAVLPLHSLAGVPA
jgi:hypothetical protein